MGGNGEDTFVYTARRVCVPQSSQKHLRVYPIGGRPAGPMQVAEGAGQAGYAALESGWFLKSSQGITYTLLEYSCCADEYTMLCHLSVSFNTMISDLRSMPGCTRCNCVHHAEITLYQNHVTSCPRRQGPRGRNEGRLSDQAQLGLLLQGRETHERAEGWRKAGHHSHFRSAS